MGELELISKLQNFNVQRQPWQLLTRPARDNPSIDCHLLIPGLPRMAQLHSPQALQCPEGRKYK